MDKGNLTKHFKHKHEPGFILPHPAQQTVGALTGIGAINQSITNQLTVAAASTMKHEMVGGMNIHFKPSGKVRHSDLRSYSLFIFVNESRTNPSSAKD